MTKSEIEHLIKWLTTQELYICERDHAEDTCYWDYFPIGYLPEKIIEKYLEEKNGP